MPRQPQPPKFPSSRQLDSKIISIDMAIGTIDDGETEQSDFSGFTPPSLLGWIAGFHVDREECEFIFKLAWPMAASAMLDQVARQVTSMLVGHIGPLFLGAATIGLMFVNVTGFSLCFGGMSSMDTLCSQAYGAENFHLVGVWAQRGAVMLTFFMCPLICGMWYFIASPVFRAIGIDDGTAALAADYCKIYTYGLWPTLMARCVQGFLRSQRIVRPVMYCTAFGAVITTGFCIWAVQTYGFYGAPLGGVVGSWINLVLLILYCLFSGCHRKCWGGWSGDAFRDLKLLAKLSTAGMASTMGQWWSMEIAAGMAGTLGTVPLAAHSCISNLMFFVFPFSYAGSIATTIRIGNLLGAGKAEEARQAGECCMAMLVAFAGAYAALTWLLEDMTPQLYTSDPAVLSLTTNVIEIFALYLTFSCGIWAVRASLNGCGMQPVSAKIALTAAYCVGIPAAAILCFSCPGGTTSDIPTSGGIGNASIPTVYTESCFGIGGGLYGLCAPRLLLCVRVRAPLALTRALGRDGAGDGERHGGRAAAAQGHQDQLGGAGCRRSRPCAAGAATGRRRGGRRWRGGRGCGATGRGRRRALGAP